MSAIDKGLVYKLVTNAEAWLQERRVAPVERCISGMLMGYLEQAASRSPSFRRHLQECLANPIIHSTK